jgi:hypothetical protein
VAFTKKLINNRKGKKVNRITLWGLALLLACGQAFASVTVQDFEGSAFPPDGWALSGAYNLWSRSIACSGYGTGQGSAMADFYNNSAGRWQELITLEVYPSGSDDSLMFDHAYACYSTAGGGEKDSLRIYGSTDNGVNWSYLASYIGGRTGPLNTGGYTGGVFVPNATQWATKRVTLPAGTNKLKFVAHSAYGNQLYIDNIRITYPTLAHDVSILAILAPAGAVAGSVVLSPSVQVQNCGSSNESFEVAMQIQQAGGPVVYSQTVPAGPLGSQASSTVNLADWAPDSGEFYNVTAWTSLAGDLWVGNDTAKGTVTTYYSPNRVMVEMFTATSCPPCVAANDSMNRVYASLMDSMSLIRTHVWWPTNNDSFYLKRQADTMENRARVSYYSVSAVPDCRIDGPLAADLYTYRSKIVSQRKVKKPLNISLLGWYDAAGDSGVIRADLYATGRIPSTGKANLTLRYAIVEDSCWYTGTNGDPRHDQVLRDMLPNNSGKPVSIDKGLAVIDSQPFRILTTGYNLPWIWTEKNCYLVAYVQNDATKEVLQSATCRLSFLMPLGLSIGDSPTGAVSKPVLFPCRPNPCRTKARIDYSMAKRGQVSLNVYDIQGRLVRSLASGERHPGKYQAVWDLRDDRGAGVASGVYFYRLSADGHQETRKLSVVR